MALRRLLRRRLRGSIVRDVHAKVKYINLLLIVYGFAQSTFPILPSNIAFKLGLFMRQMLRVLVSDCVLSAHIRRDPVPEPTVPILWFRSLGSLPLVTTPYWRQETRALNAWFFISQKLVHVSSTAHISRERFGMQFNWPAEDAELHANGLRCHFCATDWLILRHPWIRRLAEPFGNLTLLEPVKVSSSPSLRGVW
jgi:hypothetical protein